MRYLIGFLITIGLIILLIVMLVRGGDKPKVPATAKALESYATTTAEASLTIDGKINANSEHRQIKITVGKENVVYEEIKGYDGNSTEQRTFSNSTNGYRSFLHALDYAGFTQGNTDKKLIDETGHCPLGTRYIFELTQDGRTLEHFWATSCKKPKTYLGNLPSTIELFKRQVPDYANVSKDVDL